MGLVLSCVVARFYLVIYQAVSRFLLYLLHGCSDPVFFSPEHSGWEYLTPMSSTIHKLKSLTLPPFSGQRSAFRSWWYESLLAIRAHPAVLFVQGETIVSLGSILLPVEAEREDPPAVEQAVDPAIGQNVPVIGQAVKTEKMEDPVAVKAQGEEHLRSVAATNAYIRHVEVLLMAALIAAMKDPKVKEELMHSTSSAAECAERLQKNFGETRQESILSLRRRLAAMKITNDASIEQVTSELRGIYGELLRLGASEEETVKKMHLLRILPVRYDAIETALEDDDSVFEDVLDKLASKARRRALLTPATALAVSASPQRSRQRTCFRCKSPDHLISRCPVPEKAAKESGRRSQGRRKGSSSKKSQYKPMVLGTAHLAVFQEEEEETGFESPIFLGNAFVAHVMDECQVSGTESILTPFSTSSCGDFSSQEHHHHPVPLEEFVTAGLEPTGALETPAIVVAAVLKPTGAFETPAIAECCDDDAPSEDPLLETVPSEGQDIGVASHGRSGEALVALTASVRQSRKVTKQMKKKGKMAMVVDSGCTKNIVTDRDAFASFTSRRKGTVRVGGNTDVAVIGSGTIVAYATDSDGHRHEVHIQASLAPEMGFNLLSVSDTVSTGAEYTFARNQTLLSFRGFDVPLENRHMLPWLDLELPSPDDFALAAGPVSREDLLSDSSDDEDAWSTGSGDDTGSDDDCVRETVPHAISVANIHLWHRRWAHCDKTMLGRLPDAVVGMAIKGKDPSPLCPPCLKGKMKAKPIPTTAQPRDYAPGSSVAVDLCGPFVESISGHKFFMIVRDLGSRYLSGFFLKTKDQALVSFQGYAKLLRGKLSSVRLDNGELRSGAMSDFCRAEGIRIEPTVPRTPQQNPVETDIRTIVADVRVMLNDAELPHPYWEYAVRTSVWYRNRSLRGQLQRTPFELYFGSKPDVSRARVWGCLAYAHVSGDKAKLQDRAIEVIFLGFADNSTGYLVQDPNVSNVVRVVRTLKCDEDTTGGTLLRELFGDHPDPEGKLLETMVAEGDDEEWTPSESENETGTDSNLSPVPRPAIDVDARDLPDSTGTDCGELELDCLSNEDSSSTMSGDSLLTPHPSLAHDDNVPLVSLEEEESGDSFLDEEQEGIDFCEEDHNSSVLHDESSWAADSLDCELSSLLEETTVPLEEESTSYPEDYDDSADSTFFLDESAFVADSQAPFIALAVATGPPRDPKNYGEAIHSTAAVKWNDAMKKQLATLEDMGAWSTAPFPTDRSAIVSCTWVYKTKRDKYGNVTQYKARLVARGDRQSASLYGKTYAPVTTLTSLRLFLSIAVNNGLGLYHIDFQAAYLNADLEEEIFMSLPPGYPGDRKRMCLQLHKSLYGLKQSGRNWYLLLRKTLVELNFVEAPHDPCVFTHGADSDGFATPISVMIYVDDIVVMCAHKRDYRQFRDQLASSFTITDLGALNWYLGIGVDLSRRGRIEISQTEFARQFAKITGATRPNVFFDSPAPVNLDVSKRDCPDPDSDEATVMKRIPYRNALGSLGWLVLGTRPDLAQVYSQLGRVAANPGLVHWKLMQRVGYYVRDTVELGIVFTRASRAVERGTLVAYADASWADCKDDRRSTSGYLLIVGGNVVAYKSVLQKCISGSSMEAEYVAAGTAAKAVVPMRGLLQSLGFAQEEPTVLYQDNTASISNIEGESPSSRTRHIDLHYHYVRDLRERKIIAPVWVASEDMAADALTKALGPDAFLTQRTILFEAPKLPRRLEEEC